MQEPAEGLSPQIAPPPENRLPPQLRPEGKTLPGVPGHNNEDSMVVDGQFEFGLADETEIQAITQAMEIDLEQLSQKYQELKAKGALDSFSLVCDGIGGHGNGEIASAAISIALMDWVVGQLKANEKTVDKNFLAQGIAAITQEKLPLVLTLIEEKREAEQAKREWGEWEEKKPGATLAVALRKGDNLFIASVGDTRCYLKDLKTADIWLLSDDDSFVWEMAQAGLILPSGLITNLRRSILRRAVRLGKPLGEEEVTSFHLPSAQSTQVMLMGDGVWRGLRQEGEYAKRLDNTLAAELKVDVDERLTSEELKTVLEEEWKDRTIEERRDYLKRVFSQEMKRFLELFLKFSGKKLATATPEEIVNALTNENIWENSGDDLAVVVC